MVDRGQAVLDGGATTEKTSVFDQYLDLFGLYQWFAWFILIEVVVVAIAIVLNSVFDAAIVAGLIGAVAGLFAINALLVFLGLFAYRKFD